MKMKEVKKNRRGKKPVSGVVAAAVMVAGRAQRWVNQTAGSRLVAEQNRGATASGHPEPDPVVGKTPPTTKNSTSF